jgi:hypothetical protein
MDGCPQEIIIKWKYNFHEEKLAHRNNKDPK